jgi:hypothetical protein
MQPQQKSANPQDRRPETASKTLNHPYRLRLFHSLFVALEMRLAETVRRYEYSAPFDAFAKPPINTVPRSSMPFLSSFLQCHNTCGIS